MINEPEWRELNETPEEKAINDKIDEWHLNPSINEDLSLHEYLGWSWEAYQIWVLTGKTPAEG